MKKYDYDFKISVVEAYKNGLNYKEIREKFHVTKTCFYDWLKLYNTKVHQKEKTFTYKQYEELQKKFEKISRELEIIKLSHCFADSPRKQKEEAIERLIDKFHQNQTKKNINFLEKRESPTRDFFFLYRKCDCYLINIKMVIA